MNELTEIANKIGTDKGTNWDESHSFTEFYYDYFKHLKERGENINILEIGIYTGASLMMYNEFFGGNCEIYGIDIDLSKIEYFQETNIPQNFHIYKLDANNRGQVEWFLQDIGDIKFDFILDDASHMFEHQYHTFLYLYKHLKSDGKYILEDLHTWSWGDQNESTLKTLTFWDKPNMLSDEEFNEIRNAIKYVNVFIHNNPRAAFGNNTSVTSIITLKNFYHQFPEI